MVAPPFPTPWRLVSQYHGLLLGALDPIPPVPMRSLPRDVPFPFATSRDWPCPHTPPLIPCLYPAGPPATPWRGPTGSSSIRGPFRASCTDPCYPAPLCLGCLLLVGLCGDFVGSLLPCFLAPSPLPILLPAPIPPACIPCVYPTQPHATLWRLPAGPFPASCADCSYPFSRYLFSRCCVSSGGAFIFFVRAPIGLPPASPFPLCVRALFRGFLSLLWIFFFTLLPSTSPLHSSSG